MKSHCFPFRQVPHTSRLFLDYLDFSPTVQPFYPRSPRLLEWAKEESGRIQYPAERRGQISAILERQNRAWGASPNTLENIERLRSGACAIVTGQQVGLFGGPVFSIYKALSAVKLAQEARKLGVDAVPVFWLATEDHDFEEVNQVQLPGADGRLQTLVSGAESKPDAPVGSVSFGPEIEQAVARTTELLGDSEVTGLLGCYRSGENFGSAFAKFFTRVFADFGVILLDGSDPDLDRIAAPLYSAALDHAPEVTQALLDRDAKLHATGYHQQVKVTSSSTLLFAMRDGARVPIHQAKTGEFLVGEERVSRQQLLDLAAKSPQSFSPNVLLRPVVQDYLLPTLTYIGGAAEVAYFAQAAAVYESLANRTTPVIPRFSATLIESKLKALLDKYNLTVPEIFEGPEVLRETIGARRLPANLQNSFEKSMAAVQHSMKAVRESLAELDKTLIESAENAESKMLYQINNLRARAARAELRHSEVIQRHAELISNSLYPGKELQERSFAGVYFLAKHGRELMNGLLDAMHPDCLDHQIIEL
ncbi:MAG TPA: bacillithiol biosynthesis cysteine-adding enzyme BshC [Terriglobales bacterium]|nr:bacillithiol biosynthesis cysteine-adding enzyme BshC [Terriglobales bacterium]